MNTTITIKNSEGAALVGAKISYVVNGANCSCTTDPNGQAVIQLPADTYTFNVAQDGYYDATADLTIASSDATLNITMTRKIKTVVTNVAVGVAAAAAPTLIDSLRASLQAKIAGSKSWGKFGYMVLMAILDTGSDWAVNYVASKIR